MKKQLRFAVYILLLVLLAGCSNPSQTAGPAATNVTNVSIVPEATTTNSVPTEISVPVTVPPTVPTTMSTQATEAVNVPPETTAPTTIPTESTEPSVSPTEAPDNPAEAAGFGAVYDEICLLMETGNYEMDYYYATFGMSETVSPKSTVSERFASLTYALEDIDGNGTQEMIVLDALGNSRIVGVYTLQSSNPVLIKEGIQRNRLYLLQDGSFFREGNSGAAYSTFEQDSALWFTYPKAGNQAEIGYYFSADGKYDPSSALEITAEEFNAKQAALAQQIISFSTYHFGQ